MNEAPFDIVVIGSGVAGALVAWELGRAGKRVLVLEAGPDIQSSRDRARERFLLNLPRTPDSPYHAGPLNPAFDAAPGPSVRALTRSLWRDPRHSYYIQQGPLPFGAPYVRAGGGSTLAWLGISLRFLPNDFKLETLYGVGRDWPISYADLRPWYEQAERELGVSAETSDQQYLGLDFGDAYEYPMPGVPTSFLDQRIAARLDGLSVEGTAIRARPVPQARNTRPYDGRRACAGSASCVPFCPTRARYDAAATLEKAVRTGNVEVRYGAVARALFVDEETGAITGVEHLRYDRRDGPCTGRDVAVGARYVVAANGIETPKLLLASRCASRPEGAANRSDQVGRNLMDHIAVLAWGLTQDPVYPYRGPLVTSGIEDLRDGKFRNRRAAFRVDIGNDGWQWPMDDPYITVADFIDGTNQSGLNPSFEALSGEALERRVRSALTRQLRLTFLVEQLPDPENRVTLSAMDVDGLGIPRPALRYDLCPYTRGGIGAARAAARAIFEQIGGIEHTKSGSGPNVVQCGEERVTFHGVGHMMGTARMGADPGTSVVNPDLRAWDHPNLYIVGSSVFPTGGTANATLTIAALSLRLAAHLRGALS